MIPLSECLLSTWRVTFVIPGWDHVSRHVVSQCPCIEERTMGDCPRGAVNNVNVEECDPQAVVDPQCLYSLPADVAAAISRYSNHAHQRPGNPNGACICYVHVQCPDALFVCVGASACSPMTNPVTSLHCPSTWLLPGPEAALARGEPGRCAGAAGGATASCRTAAVDITTHRLIRHPHAHISPPHPPPPPLHPCTLPILVHVSNHEAIMHDHCNATGAKFERWSTCRLPVIKWQFIPHFPQPHAPATRADYA